MKVLSCKIHGDLTEEEVITCKDIHNKHGIKRKCIKCFDEQKKKTLDKHIANGFKLPETVRGICKVHGELNTNTGYICVDKYCPDGYRLRCKECNHRRRVFKYYENREENIKKAAEWKKQNRERVREQVRLDRKNNPDKYLKWSREYKERNQDKLNLNESLRRRGIDKNFYDQMMQEQKNKCAICKLEETRVSKKGDKITRLCIDHNHETGVVRQLLCHDCNTGLGKFKDNPFLLLMASDYLLNHQESPNDI